LAERLGPAAFAELKNDFFYALAEPVLETEGEVAGYVGDEAMLTWRRAAGLRDANWLRCFLLLHEGIGREAERFRARYGTVPSFKAGAHVGAVVTAQVGDLKRELAYSGDAVNTAARIEGACRELGLPLLASDALVRATPLPDAVRAVPVGAVSLRGKGAPVELWSLELGVTARA
ncbi:MAG: adenylate/guanylate cyclase domain-containing protein, partial [Rhodothermales bacterium]|nr:adenylate/guanylate cyclase domain-containing protein [Rhodothermales bacterium]